MPEDSRDSLIRYTSRLADRMIRLSPVRHRSLAVRMLETIGKKCDLDHVHLYLVNLKHGPRLSMYSEWTRTETPSLASDLQKIALSSLNEHAEDALLRGIAVYCGKNEHSESSSRIVSSMLRQMNAAAYEMIPILIHNRLRGVIAVAHDKGSMHLNSTLQHLLQLAGRIFVGGYMSAKRESRRRKNHRQWRNVANGACDFAFVLDSAMEVIQVVGFRNGNPPSVTGLRLQDIVTRTSYESVSKMIAESLRSKQPHTFEFLLFKNSNKANSYNARIEPGGDTANIACTLYLTGNDAERAAAEELAELRENLAQASRLSLSGNLASEYAHQLAQPLQVIGLQGFTLKNRLRMGEATAEQMLLNVEEILNQVEHAREVIFGMRDFLHDRRSRLTATELEVIISQALKLVQPRPDSNIAKIAVLDHEGLLEQDPPLEVHVDRVQTTYVLINLMVNAIEACREANVQEPEVMIQVESDADSANFVLVSVSDNGPGLPKGKTEHVFKRFFTTKKSGFGFGLAICRDVLERQRGKIEAANNPTRGCTFTFSLLLQSDEADEETHLLEEAAEEMMEQEDQ